MYSRLEMATKSGRVYNIIVKTFHYRLGTGACGRSGDNYQQGEMFSHTYLYIEMLLLVSNVQPLKCLFLVLGNNQLVP